MGIKTKIILLAVMLGSLTAVCVGGLSVYNTFTMRDDILSDYRQTMIEERGEKLKAVTQALMTMVATLDTGREMYVEGEQLKV
ncbi:MAG: hypothetical protein J7L25_14825, partial [Deltaproteobacteria bacterium]|nr:hypothetical protein [Candidatus Tharpella aukensis]